MLLEFLYYKDHNRIIFWHKNNIINENWCNNLKISLKVNIDGVVTMLEA